MGTFYVTIFLNNGEIRESGATTKMGVKLNDGILNFEFTGSIFDIPIEELLDVKIRK